MPLSSQALEPFELAPYLSQFTTEMASVGLTTLTINGYSDAVRHFGTWLNENAINLCDVTPKTLDRFSTHRCMCPGNRSKNYVSKKYARRVSRFIKYLRETKVLDSEEQHIIKPSPCWDRDGFTSWLSCDRGLVDITVTNYTRALTQIFPVLGHDVQ